MNVLPAPGSRPTGRPRLPSQLPSSLLTPQLSPQQPTVDLSQDPVLQQIQAFHKRQVDEATANELAGRKQALISYGYNPAFESLYPDESTKRAAKDNPFSVLANLAHGYQQRTGNLEEGLNKNNLFYSSYRGQQLGENARQYQQEQATAAGNFQDRLSSLAQSLASARDTAAQGDVQALGEAYGRYKPPDTPDQRSSIAATIAARPLTGVAPPRSLAGTIRNKPKSRPLARPGAGLGAVLP